jgi:hypothetical protein
MFELSLGDLGEDGGELRERGPEQAPPSDARSQPSPKFSGSVPFSMKAGGASLAWNHQPGDLGTFVNAGNPLRKT